MTLKLRDRLSGKPQAADISRLIKPLLTSYARAHNGSFMIVEGKQTAPAKNPEIHCLFAADEAPAAADYATKLVANFGISCDVSAKTHPELLNHLSRRATFSRDRRLNNRN